MLLAPTALAAGSLSATRLEIVGTTQMSGDATALFVVADGDSFLWEITAQSATLTRRFVESQHVDNPLKDGHYLASKTFNDLGWNEETVELADVTLTSTGVLPGGALLAVFDAAALETSAVGLSTFEWRRDPTIEQSPADVETAGADRGFVKASLEGDHSVATLEGADATVLGDVTLQLFGPSYTLASADGTTTDERTGEFETSRTASASTTRREHHVLVLTGASLHLVAPGLSEAYTKFPRVDFEGTLTARGAEGALDLGTGPVFATGGALTWTGASALTLDATGGRLHAAPIPASVATNGAIVDSGPRLAIVSAALAVLALAAVAVLLVARLRSRRDDLAVALLAMEERRWEDAIPPLTRLAKKQPHNADLLVDRALALDQAGRVEEAAKAFERALRAAPLHAEAHFYYARTLARMRESEAARVHLETALENDPRLVELARGERVLRGL